MSAYSVLPIKGMQIITQSDIELRCILICSHTGHSQSDSSLDESHYRKTAHPQHHQVI